MCTFAKLSSTTSSAEIGAFFSSSMYLFINSNEPTNSSQEGKGGFFAVQM